jgi:hypothetical protein
VYAWDSVCETGNIIFLKTTAQEEGSVQVSNPLQEGTTMRD